MNPQMSFGAHESLDDIRTINHSDLATATIPPPSYAVSYAGIVHDNQRAIGICTAANMADMLHKIFGFPVSEQFIYVVGKQMYDGNMDEGSSLLTMLKVCKNYGAPRKELVPTDDTTKSYADYVNVTFGPEVYADALKQRIKGYAAVNLDPTSFASALANSKYGLITMMRVGDNFYTPSWLEKDLEPLRAPNPVTGGHSIKVIAYDGLDSQQKRTMRNTWGDSQNPVFPNAPTWGREGDLDYIYTTQKPYLVEAWVILMDDPIFHHTFNKQLKYGQTSPEVAILQRVLIQDGIFPTTQKTTGYYGDITAKAVLDFRTKYHVSSVTDPRGHNVGPLTLAKLNALYGV